MIFDLIVIIASAVTGLLLPKFTIDECKGKDKILSMISKGLLVLIASLLIFLVNDLQSLIIGSIAGVILTFSLRRKIKIDLSHLFTGLSYGLTINPLIAYSIVLYNLPTFSALSLPLFIKSKKLKPVLKLLILPLALFIASVVISYLLYTYKGFITALSAGALLLIGICGLTNGVKKK